jgi:hypothetical protein
VQRFYTTFRDGGLTERGGISLQTGTGKTYTMEGAVMTGPERGIIPRAIEDVFINIENDAAPSRCVCTTMMCVGSARAVPTLMPIYDREPWS